MKNTRLFLMLAIFTIAIQAQETKLKNKGKFYAYWGWNRSAYSASDITFKGDDYNFTLKDVVAKDKQIPFSANKYLNPGNVTLPQTNAAIGYFFSENYSVVLGLDHMKYVTVQDQWLTINGEIDPSYGVVGADGAVSPFVDNGIKQTEDFLKFEHTDGLNYIHLSVNRFDDISSRFGLHSENFVINLTEGIGAGILLPKTNSTLLGKERHDDFHVSGYGIHAQLGLNFVIYKHFFIQTDLRTGYINMSDIRTTQSKSDSASQDFKFIQGTLLIGGRFKIF
ncbi:hypothetical protein FHR24_001818 [Wenyingzhuangia heitensis]|uniref:Outer membrane protein beta-barrel domain-containing protein n=1 Tax=Wenyingzhuangia heitensis TaxID=1487859 RepID=A0ABX0UBR3_9FLAO|nr:hypothetical protein [Wenyingzhuangia heitensis]NIJ45350.1 hypothetical protein [Wenyingzhuangia heitensis]